MASLLLTLLAGDPAGLAAQSISAATAGAVADDFRVDGLDDRRFDHATYWSVVGTALDADRSERLRMQEVGRSIEGRTINTVAFGQGPTTVLLWSQMHGDESAASMSLADIINWVARSPDDDPLRRALEERLTVTMIPMLNPDGAQRFIRHNAVGVDVNRDARRLATPEARALKAVRDSLDADFGFNLHDQGSQTAGPGGDLVGIALLAPAADEERSWGPTRQRARHLTAVIAATMQAEIPGRVARYDDGFTPRAFGDNMQAWGTSTVLIESGALAGDPQKQQLRRLNVIAILESLRTVADGSYESMDTKAYDDLPMNTSVGDDLVLAGGSVVMPDGETYRLDVAIGYDDAVARTGPRYGEVGDLTGVRSIESFDATGLFIHPDLGTEGSLRRGEPVRLVVRRGADPSSEEVMRLPGGTAARQ